MNSPFSIGEVLGYRLPSGKMALTQVYAQNYVLGVPGDRVVHFSDSYSTDAPIFVAFRDGGTEIEYDKASSRLDRETVVDVISSPVVAWEWIIPRVRGGWGDDWCHIGVFPIMNRLNLPLFLNGSELGEEVELVDLFTEARTTISGPVSRNAYRTTGASTVGVLDSILQIATSDPDEYDPETRDALSQNPEGIRAPFNLG
ncbi:hypothetical protein JVX90_01835 [Gordonia sp. PDNC005]|uniref:hypothetical protein n=1 Tax=unclassified Gordonia (in: high G+C Gram-positive bacteria) TaxID=2657482 RepID=UPI001964E71F|nr:hypothetical protein [Gordonia sp. PDNC005]QRY63017.1 hypothetical protein JVX90_01835 [Gordonia sp. PDNC005]